MIFPTATTRNSCPITASSTANVCPGLAAGIRFPYPTVVIVAKLKNRSWLSEPGPPSRRTLRSELVGRLVGEGEEHADQQVGSDSPEQRLGVDLTAYRQMTHDGERRNQVEQAADREYPAQLITRLVREQAHDHAHGGQAQHDVGDEADQRTRPRGPECEPDRG